MAVISNSRSTGQAFESSSNSSYNVEKITALADVSDHADQGDTDDATSVISNNESVDMSETSSAAAAATVEAVLVEANNNNNNNRTSTPGMKKELSETTKDPSMSTILCCVDDDQHIIMSSFSASVKLCQNEDPNIALPLPATTTQIKESKGDDFFMLPSSNAVTAWTENTRRRFELSIESLLSTVDSTGTRSSTNANDTTGNDGSGALSAAYEDKYRSMVQNGLAILESKDSKMINDEDDGNSAAADIPTNNNNKEDHGELDQPHAAVDPFTMARRAFSPLDRSAHLRRMRRRMSHSDRAHNVKTTSTARSRKSATATATGATATPYDDLRGKAAQSFDEEYLRRESRRASLITDGVSARNGSAGSDSNGSNANNGTSNSSSTSSGNALARYFQNACSCGDASRLEPVEEYNERMGSAAIMDKALFVSDDDELHAYDSDPELFHTVSSSTSFGVAVRGSKNKSAEEKGAATHHATEAPRPINLLDDEATSSLIDEITHDTMTLVWHPPAEASQGAKTSAPSCVKSWIELGCRVKGQIIQPKLVWRSAHQKKKDKCNPEPSLPSISTSGGVDILDISRVRALTDIERKEFPLAKKSRSFAIVTSDKMTYIFEAKNKQEKERIMLSLKLLVARLASLIIVGDERLFADFFYPESSADFHKVYDMGIRYKRSSSTFSSRS